MRLSWNEIRTRAANFAKQWEGQGYEKGQTQLFYRDFFDVFGMPVRRVASFEEPVKLLGEKRGFVDLLWKGVLLVEQKSAGRGLVAAKTQALNYFPGLKDAELPRYILLSDFQTFELHDLDEGWSETIRLAELPKHVLKFAFILGVQKRTFRDQDPVNIEASTLMGQLHDALKESGYSGPDLERFLVRLLFCLFADDTGIFEPRGRFLELMADRTRVDGSDTGPLIQQLFEVLNTPEDRRHTTLDADLAGFPYINGDLFARRLPIPSFDARMRGTLKQACEFNWEAISPAIFGSLFQHVLSPAERRADGKHYTTEKNILKVIEPLFLDELRDEFERIRTRKDSRRQQELRRFQSKLGNLRFFDPACGCGNFLVIAYREIRQLEIAVLLDLVEAQRGREGEFTKEIDVADQSVVDVHQFFGIELGEFPARIAETALWMMDHIMNVRLSLALGDYRPRIPLRRAPRIEHGDALELDWNSVLPATECSYVLGNPPFVGAKYQSPSQRAQVRRIARLGGSGGTLDYVAAWFILAARYVQGSARIGFVATNSITQGEQVAQLWPLLLDSLGMEIPYAHRTFAWGSDAKGKAHVHVVIVGLDRSVSVPPRRRLFSYDSVSGEPHESHHAAITPYLFDGGSLNNPHLVVRELGRPLNGLPPLLSGTQPIDDGNYIFTEHEREEFIQLEPGADRFMRPYVGSREHINGRKRWILALQGATPRDLRELPLVRERMRRVREFRSKSIRLSTLAIAPYPEKYNVEVIPESPFLIIPETSSERREYIPIAWMEPPIIPSNLVRIILGADVPLFGLLTSAMHMSWMRHIGGRLESRYRYSIGLVYNTFPMPPGGLGELQKVRPYAREVLDAREKFAGESLGNLYDPDLMPTGLRKAHHALDREVDKLYRRSGFTSDRERVEHLFGLYEQMIAPLAALAKPPRRRNRR